MQIYFRNSFCSGRSTPLDNRRGEGLSIKNFIQHLGPQFGLKNKAGPSPGSAAVPYLIVYYCMFIDNSFVPTAPLRVDFILLNDH